MTDTNYPSLVSTDTNSDAIDIYLLSPNDTYARAVNIPGIALAVGGSYRGTSVLSHELGHCLGLYHTHSGRGCNDNANCAENINGSNCSTCGDLVCDTPADPCLSGNVNTSCEYIGDPAFSPDVNNIMSYSPPDCLNRLTSGQTERIHFTILNNSIFATRSSKPFTSGPSIVCSSGTSFTIGNLPPVDSIIWEHGPYLTISSGQNTANCTFSAVGNGNSWVRARLFTGCGEGITLPDKDVATVWPSGTWVQNGQSHPLNTVNFITYGSWIQATVSCPGLTGSNWVLTHSSGISWNQGFYNGMSYVNLYPSTPQSYADFRLDLNTADCGTISPTYHFVPGYGYAFTMSPNPAEDEVVVKRLDKNQVDERNTLKPKLEKYKQKEFKTWDTPQEKFTVKLYSERLGLLKTVHTEDESCRIDLRSLPAGTYFLHIENDYVLYQEQLIIRK